MWAATWLRLAEWVEAAPVWAFRRLVVRRAAALSVECVAHPRGPPDDLDVLRRGPPRPDVPRLARNSRALQLLGGLGAEDLHRGTVVVAEPGRVAAADEAHSANPWSSSTSAPALTHRPIGAGGAAVAESTDTAADAASRGPPARPRRHATSAGAGNPRRCHCRTPESRKRRRPVQASMSPLLISGGVRSTRRQFRAGWNRGLVHNAQPVSGRRAQSGPTSCSTAPTEPRFSDAEIPKPVEFDHDGSPITGVRDAGCRSGGPAGAACPSVTSINAAVGEDRDRPGARTRGECGTSWVGRPGSMPSSRGRGSPRS